MSQCARTLREAAGISQTEAARRAHVTQSALSHIERGTRRPSLDLAVRLARIYGMTVEQFYAELGPRQPSTNA